ncbi:DNA-binding transcription factor [Lithospermum erythrorhizon]|uniref:DNA-binding transcription factor n=1 Tax=Lithospermum erythrorhizon TaxID=34254 RepID=A0AAV3RJF3_LITER
MEGEERCLPNYDLQQQVSFSTSQVIQEMGFVQFEDQNHQLFAFLSPPSQSTQISRHLEDHHTHNPSTNNTVTTTTTLCNDSLGFNRSAPVNKKSSWTNNQVQNLDPKASNDESYSANGNEGSDTWWKSGSSERSKMKSRRKLREPRFCFQTRSDVDVLDDGYKWRKYGQKVVKNSLHPSARYDNKIGMR